MAPRGRLSDNPSHNCLFVELRNSDALQKLCNIVKSNIEGASWPWSSFEHTIDATKDVACVQKDYAAPAPPREELLNGGPCLWPGKRSLNKPSNWGGGV